MSQDVRLRADGAWEQPRENDPVRVVLTVEKVHAAFDWMAGELSRGRLGARETIECLRVLSRLTRLYFAQRESELLGIALGIAADAGADCEVRSAATRVAIANALIARRVTGSSRLGRPTKAVVGEAVIGVCRAMELGLSPEVEALAEAFLVAVRGR